MSFLPCGQGAFGTLNLTLTLTLPNPDPYPKNLKPINFQEINPYGNALESVSLSISMVLDADSAQQPESLQVVKSWGTILLATCV